MSNTLIDDIQLRVTAPKNPLVGLDNALAKLNALNSSLAALQSRLANLKTDAAFKRTASSFTSDIKTSGEQSRKQLTKLFGFGEKDVSAFVRNLRDTSKAEFRRFFTDLSGDTLRNPTVAGKFYAKYSRAALKNSGDPMLTLQQMFSGGALPKTLASTPPPAPPAGGGGGGSGSGGGRRGSGSGGGGDADKEKFSVARQQARNELQKQLREARAVNDPRGMARAQDKAARELELLAGRYKLSALQQARLDGEVEKLRTQAARNRSRSDQRVAGVQRASAAAADRASAATAPETIPATRRVAIQRASAALAEKDRLAMEKSLRRQQEKQLAEQERFERNRIRIQRNSAALAERLNKPVRPPPLPKQERSIFAGFEPAQFAANVAKVTGWAAAVGVLYKTIDLATSSLNSLISTGAQMARLDQVFSKIGGTTRELTDDTLALAAANGRSKEEAMEAAIQWSRLGLSRAQVNEAVRASLIAANVAEISAGEATEKLQAIMAAYGLQVSQVSGVLGELNAVSNVYNATVGGMLEGLARTASVAKQAGLPLTELVGMLGAAIGTTGQSGANIGNAIKSITVALSNPVLQETLRRQFKIEVTSGGGEEIKTMSQILGELYDRYQDLNNAQRQSLLFSVAGKTQASRLAAILDSYVKGQSLAITAQLNLNSAEQENAKIKATLKSRIQGLVTEWDRLIAVQGSSPSALLGGLSPADALGETITGVRNLIALMNFRIGSESGSIGNFLMGGVLGSVLVRLQKINDMVDKLRGGPEAAKRAAAGFDAEAEKFGGLANAGDLQQRSIQRLGRLAAGPDFLQTLKAGGTQPFLFDSSSASQERAQGVMRQLRVMKEQGDVAGVQVLLQRELEMAVHRTTAAREQEWIQIESANQLLDEKIAKLEALQAGGYDEGRAKEIATLEAMRGRTQNRLLALPEEGDGQLFEAKQQKMALYQERMKAQLERISQLYRDMPVDGPVQAAQREMEMLREQIRLLEIKERSVLFSGASQEAITHERRAITKQRMGLEAQLGGTSATLGMARLQERMGFGRELGRNDAAAGTFGLSATERLNNRQSAVIRQMNQIRANPANLDDPVQVGRLLELQNQALQIRVQLREREAQIVGEIKQLEMGRAREFQKSMLSAGPAELLRKLAAQKLAPGMTAGGFMALSPELRQDVAMLNPKFNPDLADLRREQGQNIRPGGADGEMKIREDLRELTAGLIDRLMPAGDRLNEAALTMRDAANEAMLGLANLQVLQQLPEVVAKIMAAAGGMIDVSGPFIPMGTNAGEISKEFKASRNFGVD